MKPLVPLVFLTIQSFAATNCSPDLPATCYPDTCERCYCLGPAETLANSPVGPYTCDGDVSVSVSALYWQGKQEGLEYALDNQVFIDPDPADFIFFFPIHNIIEADYKTPDFKWNAGFQLGLGYTFACDGWDANVLWTHFDGRARSHVEAETNENHVLIPMWSAFAGSRLGLAFFAFDIKANWKLNLNLVDATLGRAFWTSRYLSIRPYLGLRFASLVQDYALEQKGGTYSPYALQPAVNDFIDLYNRFQGVGLLSGLSTNWHVGCGFSLFGDVAASIVYGHFVVRAREHYRLVEAPFAKTEVLSTDKRLHASRAVLDLELGVEYNRGFCDCKYRFIGRLGWQQHTFFDQNQLFRVRRYRILGDVFGTPFPNDEGNNVHQLQRGNLDTRGLSLSLTFEY